MADRPSTEDTDGMMKVLKADTFILLGGTLLLMLFSMLPSRQDAGEFMGLMIFFNLAGVAGNFAAAILFAFLGRGQRAVGSVLGAIYFALAGFGLCFGAGMILEAMGIPPLILH